MVNGDSISASETRDFLSVIFRVCDAARVLMTVQLFHCMPASIAHNAITIPASTIRCAFILVDAVRWITIYLGWKNGG